MNEIERIYKKVESILIEGNPRSTYIGEDDFVSLSKNGLTINFHIKNSSLRLETILRAALRAKKIIGDRFKYELKEAVIDLVDTVDELRQIEKSESRYGSWIAGVCDGRIRVIAARDDEDPQALYIILTHEIIHLALNRITGGKCPNWLDEGLAIYLSQNLPDEYLEGLALAEQKDRLFPLEALEKPFGSNLDEVLRRLIYAQSWSLASYLVETLGWEKIRSVLDQCRRRAIGAVLADLGLNYYLIEQGWKRWRRNQTA